MAAELEFSVRDWLRAVGLSHYEENFLEHGYKTYHSCVSLSKADLLAAGVSDSVAEFLANKVKELRTVWSEEDAIRELSVSICCPQSCANLACMSETFEDTSELHQNFILEYFPLEVLSSHYML